MKQRIYPLFVKTDDSKQQILCIHPVPIIYLLIEYANFTVRNLINTSISRSIFDNTQYRKRYIDNSMEDMITRLVYVFLQLYEDSELRERFHAFRIHCQFSSILNDSKIKIPNITNSKWFDSLNHGKSLKYWGGKLWKMIKNTGKEAWAYLIHVTVVFLRRRNCFVLPLPYNFSSPTSTSILEKKIALICLTTEIQQQ